MFSWKEVLKLGLAEERFMASRRYLPINLS